MHNRTLVLLCFAFSFLSLAATSTPRPSDQPLPTQFDRAQWRAIYLDLIEEPQIEPVRVVNRPAPGTPEAALVDWYIEHIEPRHREEQNIYLPYAGLHLLIDSGLYESDDELKTWSRQKAEILKKAAIFSTDDAWLEKVREFARRAENLNGELAQFARVMLQSNELGQFPTANQAQLQELYRLDQEVDEIASQLQAKDRAMAVNKEINQIENDFFVGRMSFSDAAKKIEELSWFGASAIGKELKEKAEPQMQRIAVLRSLLAKTKGFATWADYQIATQGQHHGPEFQNSEQILRFLNRLVEQTQVSTYQVYSQSASRSGKQLKDLRPAEFFLLLPPAQTRVLGYFQKEKIESMWRESMRQSGFSPQLTQRVMVDAFPRERKQGHAYMFPARMQYPVVQVLDGSNLKFQFPEIGSPLLTQAVTAIVQNFTDDSIDDLRTMFHEGGHGLDYASAVPRTAIEYQSSSSAETASTQGEQFTQDALFLKHFGLNRKGEKLTDSQIQLYLRDKTLLDLITFRGNVLQSIYDIELWRYDYSQPSAQTLFDRARELNRQNYQVQRGVPIPAELVEARGLTQFSTDHFYSGSVRYFGYVLAEVSASLVNKAVLDKLERTTGQRTLFNQPSLASIILPFYQENRLRQFPQSIEHFTGEAFSADLFARQLNAQVAQALHEQQAQWKSRLKEACGSLLLLPSPRENKKAL